MSFLCPYCRHSISVKSPKPGRYKPKCPSCGKAFSLQVPEDPEAILIAEAIKDSKPVEPAQTERMAAPGIEAKAKPDPAKTVAMSKPAATATPGNADAEKTGVFREAPATKNEEDTAIFKAPAADPNATVVEKPTQVGGDSGAVAKDNKRSVDPNATELRKPKPIAPVLLQEVEPKEAPAERTSRFEMLTRLINLILGPFSRFLVGAALLAGFLMWMYQNGLIEKTKDVKTLDDSLQILAAKDSKPLEFAALPNFLTRQFDGFAAGLAGLLLLLSAFVHGWKTAILMPPAAAIIVLGPRIGVPDIGPLSSTQICMAVGGSLGLLAIALSGRRR